MVVGDSRRDSSEGDTVSAQHVWLATRFCTSYMLPYVSCGGIRRKSSCDVLDRYRDSCAFLGYALSDEISRPKSRSCQYSVETPEPIYEPIAIIAICACQTAC